MSKSLKQRSIYIIIGIFILLFGVLPFPSASVEAGGTALSREGRISLCILLFCLFLWITEPIPFHITGLFGILLTALFKIASFKDAVKTGFGSDTVIFFLGVLILSEFMSKSGLGKRISMFILSLTGNRTSYILLGFLTVGTILSMWVTDMAVAAMLTPLACAMLKEEGLEPLKSNFGKSLMISCAWGPIVGGIGTPAGAGPNQLAIGFIQDMLGEEITFLQWMVYGIPCALVLILPTWFVLLKCFPPEIRTLSKSNEDLKEEFKCLPKMSKDEISTCFIFLFTIFCWVCSSRLEKILGISIPTSLPALLGACLLFLPGLSRFTWKDINENISWSGIILIATGITVGMELYNTGAAEWLSNILLGRISELQPILMIFVLIIVISILKVGLSSNTVTATVIIPIVIVMIQSFHLPVMGVLIPASLTLSLAFILVTSTPTSVIPYSTGYFSIPDMAKAGVILTLISSVIMTICIYLIGLITGIY